MVGFLFIFVVVGGAAFAGIVLHLHTLARWLSDSALNRVTLLYINLSPLVFQLL